MKLFWSLVTTLFLLLGSWPAIASEEAPLNPHERRVIRDLLLDRSEDISGNERRLLMDFKNRDNISDEERQEFERIKRREWSVEEGERD